MLSQAIRIIICVLYGVLATFNKMSLKIDTGQMLK